MIFFLRLFWRSFYPRVITVMKIDFHRLNRFILSALHFSRNFQKFFFRLYRHVGGRASICGAFIVFLGAQMRLGLEPLLIDGAAWMRRGERGRKRVTIFSVLCELKRHMLVAFFKWVESLSRFQIVCYLVVGEI